MPLRATRRATEARSIAGSLRESLQSPRRRCAAGADTPDRVFESAFGPDACGTRHVGYPQRLFAALEELAGWAVAGRAASRGRRSRLQQMDLARQRPWRRQRDARMRPFRHPRRPDRPQGQPPQDPGALRYTTPRCRCRSPIEVREYDLFVIRDAPDRRQEQPSQEPGALRYTTPRCRSAIKVRGCDRFVVRDGLIACKDSPHRTRTRCATPRRAAATRRWRARPAPVYRAAHGRCARPAWAGRSGNPPAWRRVLPGWQ